MPFCLLDILSFLTPVFLIIPSLTSSDTSIAAFANGQRRARRRGKEGMGKNREEIEKGKGEAAVFTRN